MSEDEDLEKIKVDKFCKSCNSDIRNKLDEQWHSDCHGRNNIVLRKDVVEEGKDNSTKDARKDNRKLYDHALTKINKLVISENNSNEVYALVKKEKGVHAFKVNSKRFYHWLRNEYDLNINSKEIRTDDFFKAISNSIFSYAVTRGAKTEKIYNRIAQRGDEIWYYIADQDGKVIKITGKGVLGTILDLDSPIFAKNQSTQQQVMPKRENEKAIDELIDLLKISEHEKLVFKVNLIALFLEAYPMPLMVLGGPAGNFKSTTTALIKRIVDPEGSVNDNNLSAISSKVDDFLVHLYNRYFPCYDNVSNISREEADILCRVITGGTNVKRKLFSDDEEIIMSGKRKIALNGIVPRLDYPDLQSRLLIYEREPPKPKDKRTHEFLNKKFEELLPDVLGQIFLTLSKAISWYKSLKFDIKPKTRMADFEVWGEVISRVMGNQQNEFLKMYYQKLDNAVISMEESYPLISVLSDFMKFQDSYEGTASELYHSLLERANVLEIDVRSKWVRFPRAASGLGKSFKELDSLLKVNGLEAKKFSWTGSDKIHSKHSTIFKIFKTNPQMKLQELSSPSSPSSPQAQKTGEDSEENHSSEHGEDSEAIFQ